MNNDTKHCIAFEGVTLEEAYKKASKEFDCSIIDLKSEVIQAPSNGFLGLFKKNAIISVYKCLNNKNQKSNKNQIKIKDVSLEIKEMLKDIQKVDIQKIQSSHKITSQDKKNDKLFSDFYTSDDTTLDNNIITIQDDKIIQEIKKDINKLFSSLCYSMDAVKVSYYDEKTIFIEFSGQDSALLIGKEGYRYKALSYIIFNWIHDKYDLMVRLEIAQFLEQQEEAIFKYLKPVIQTIKEEGFYKTKQLDGILIHIALTKLREEFPNKYIAVKTNIRGERYILINEYKK